MPKIITSNSSSSGASEFQQLNVDWESNRGVTEILNKPKNATTIKDGFMSKEDKIKLNGVTESPTKLSQLTKDINFDERYYTETEMDTKLGGKVNNNQVLTNVPIGAKFTDTDTITTINGKTGAIAKADIVALGIPTSDTNTTYTAGTGLTLTGTVFTPTFGSTMGTVTQGNDSRLSNARTPLAHNHLKSDITDFPLLATVATSGSYNDLASKPTIPTNTTQLSKGDVYTKTEVDGLLSDAGLGDMLKSVYDTNGNGIVDNAEKVNGFTIGMSVPANAKFTDTIYSHPSTHPSSMITGLGDITIDGGTF